MHFVVLSCRSAVWTAALSVSSAFRLQFCFSNDRVTSQRLTFCWAENVTFGDALSFEIGSFPSIAPEPLDIYLDK